MRNCVPMWGSVKVWRVKADSAAGHEFAAPTSPSTPKKINFFIAFARPNRYNSRKPSWSLPHMKRILQHPLAWGPLFFGAALAVVWQLGRAADKPAAAPAPKGDFKPYT